MTAPKHIPLTAQMKERVEHWAAWFVEAMTAVDDAHDVDFEEED